MDRFGCMKRADCALRGPKRAREHSVPVNMATGMGKEADCRVLINRSSRLGEIEAD